MGWVCVLCSTLSKNMQCSFRVKVSETVSGTMCITVDSQQERAGVQVLVQAGPSCVALACSFCACVGFLWELLFPPSSNHGPKVDPPG